MSLNGGMEHGPMSRWLNGAVAAKSLVPVVATIPGHPRCPLMVDTWGEEVHQVEGVVLQVLVNLSGSGGSRQVPTGQVDCGLGSF